MRTRGAGALIAAVAGVVALGFSPSGAVADTADAEAAGCERTKVVAPIGGGEQQSRMDCAFIGTPGTKITYSIDRDPISKGTACFQVLGYERVNVALPPALPKYENRSRWFDAGCGPGTKLTVTWGEVADAPAIRAEASVVPYGWAGSFAV